MNLSAVTPFQLTLSTMVMRWNERGYRAAKLETLHKKKLSNLRVAILSTAKNFHANKAEEDEEVENDH